MAYKKLMTGKELAEKAVKMATEVKTLYVMGGWGRRLTAANKKREIAKNAYNKKAARKAKIEAADDKTFGFDCVGAVKAISAWGFTGDVTKTAGGTSYGSNGVADMSIAEIVKKCTDVSSDFKKIEAGEFVWLKDKGHCGIYVGGGLVVESTPVWKDGLQVTACGNIGEKAGYKARTWYKHGKMPWIAYPAAVLNGDDIYIVVKGDYLGKIAKKFNTTVAKLQKLNGIKNANLIYVGQRIRIK